MKLALLVPAAGASRRYGDAGGRRSKLDEDLGGRPVLQRTIELFVKHENVGALLGSIIVAGPHDPEAYGAFKEKYGDRLALMGCTICRGGLTHRYETVKAALENVSPDETHIAIHDAARPCTPPELIERVVHLAERHAAVIPALEVTDTLKRVRTTDEPEQEDDPVARILGTSPEEGPKLRVVDSTIDRRGVFAVQTPQVFRADVLRRAYALSDLTSTDDAALVERLGERVVVVEGDARNIKITHPGDLALARAILGAKPPEERAAHKRF